MLIAKKVQISTEYLGFLDVFLEEEVLILPKATKLNQHAIELQEDYKLLYRPIYSLGSVELKMLKIYIKTNLANDFIWPLKSPAGVFILFV